MSLIHFASGEAFFQEGPDGFVVLGAEREVAAAPFRISQFLDQLMCVAGDLPAGASTLLVDWSQLGYTVPLGEHGFADCKLLQAQDVVRLGRVNSSFRFYACHGWSGQPQPRLAGAS